MRWVFFSLTCLDKWFLEVVGFWSLCRKMHCNRCTDYCNMRITDCEWLECVPDLPLHKDCLHRSVHILSFIFLFYFIYFSEAISCFLWYTHYVLCGMDGCMCMSAVDCGNWIALRGLIKFSESESEKPDKPDVVKKHLGRAGRSSVGRDMYFQKIFGRWSDEPNVCHCLSWADFNQSDHQPLWHSERAPKRKHNNKKQSDVVLDGFVKEIFT